MNWVHYTINKVVKVMGKQIIIHINNEMRWHVIRFRMQDQMLDFGSTCDITPTDCHGNVAYEPFATLQVTKIWHCMLQECLERVTLG